MGLKGYKTGAVKIIETQKINIKRPVIVEGFPGIGMIGTASMMYLVRELKMDLCGYIVSDRFPPLVTIHDGIPLPPVRIYKSEKYNLIVILSEFAIPLRAVNEVCSDILEWAAEKNARVLYTLGGIDMKVPEEDIDRVFATATTPETKKIIEREGITVIKEGITTGVTGVLLSLGYVKNFPVISLLTPSRPLTVDLLSAAAVLKAFTKLENIPVSVEKLIEEGMKIEVMLKEIFKNAKTVGEKYKKLEEYTQTYR
jgi:uncharacterized protein